MPLQPYEMFICVVAVLAWWFALSMASDMTDGRWRTPTAALGTILIASGFYGMASLVRQGVVDMAAVSRASQEVVLANAVEHAWRPMFFALAATALFLLLIRNSIPEDGSNRGMLPAGLIVLGGTLSAVFTAVYLLGLGELLSAATTLQALNLTIWASVLTITVSVVLGILSGFTGSRQSAA